MGFREEIKREAIGLFFKMGVKNVRMDTIAQRLKVSKRTIYENFKNKDSLIREAIDLHRKNKMKFMKK
jgi:TetR/AcrR family transcriptional regulator, cholesterol catabolism regulator